MGNRSTKIKTWNNHIIIIPNGKLSNSTVQNFLTDDRKARVTVEFGVAYGTKIETVEEVVEEETEETGLPQGVTVPMFLFP